MTLFASAAHDSHVGITFEDVCIGHPSGNVIFETWLASSLQRFLSDRSVAACFAAVFLAARVIFQARP
jgi:hypothetical protein